MGLTLEERPIRGGNFPPRASAPWEEAEWAKRGPYGGRLPPLAGCTMWDSPTWLSQGVCTSSSTYIYGCPPGLLECTSSLSLSCLSRDFAIGVVHGLRFSPPYAHRRAAGLPVQVFHFRCSSLDRSPEVVISTVCV